MFLKYHYACISPEILVKMKFLINEIESLHSRVISSAARSKDQALSRRVSLRTSKSSLKCCSSSEVLMTGSFLYSQYYLSVAVPEQCHQVSCVDFWDILSSEIVSLYMR